MLIFKIVLLLRLDFLKRKIVVKMPSENRDKILIVVNLKIFSMININTFF